MNHPRCPPLVLRWMMCCGGVETAPARAKPRVKTADPGARSEGRARHAGPASSESLTEESTLPAATAFHLAIPGCVATTQSSALAQRAANLQALLYPVEQRAQTVATDTPAKPTPAAPAKSKRAAARRRAAAPKPDRNRAAVLSILEAQERTANALAGYQTRTPSSRASPAPRRSPTPRQTSCAASRHVRDGRPRPRQVDRAGATAVTAQPSSGGPIPTLAPHSQLREGSRNSDLSTGTLISIRSASSGSR